MLSINEIKNEIDAILSNGESDTIEFKESRKGFPHDALKTICSFANTEGGILILGVSEENNKFYVSGVDNPTKLRDEMFNLLNNPNKINRNVITNEDVKVVDLPDKGNKTIIVIFVHKQNYREKPIFLNGNTANSYYRYGTGDHKCTSDTINAMIRDSSQESLDSKLVEGFTVDDLDDVTIEKFRSRLSNLNPEHVFLNLPKEEFLKKLSVIRENRVSKKLEPTVAGLLVFGLHTSIKEYLPHYNVEYINKEKGEQNRSYKDRLIYDGTWGEDNLYTFLFQVLDKIFLSIREDSEILSDSITRKSPSKIKIAIREAIVNSIIHSDYKVPIGIKIIRYPDHLVFINGGSLRISKQNYFSGGHSEPRNYLIQEIFRIVNLCEKAGTGVPKIMEAVKSGNLKYPELNTTLDSVELKIWDTSIVEVLNIQNETEAKILEIIVKSRIITRLELDNATGFHKNTVLKYLRRLEENGIIEKQRIRNVYYYKIKEHPNFAKYGLISNIETLIEEIKRSK